MVYTWALKGLPYHDFGAYVYTIKPHGALGLVLEGPWPRLWVLCSSGQIQLWAADVFAEDEVAQAVREDLSKTADAGLTI